MNLCVFEDGAVSWLEPLTLTRPAFDLRCGTGTLLDRQLRAFDTREAQACVRPQLAALCQMNHPHLSVNNDQRATEEPLILANARWLAPKEPIADLTPHVGIIAHQVAYAVLPAGYKVALRFECIEHLLEGLRRQLPARLAAGDMINYLWEVVEHNPAVLGDDLEHFRATTRSTSCTSDISIIGPGERLIVADSAEVEPYVTFDTRHGAVLIDRGAVIKSFTRIEGPCYIGADSAVVGGKICRSTIGPSCRVAGEVEDSIVQGFSNKYHDGFLGHSYLGEWVNIAAGTQFSDLRNDYGPVTVTLRGQRIPTGRLKVGAFIGDHTKTGLGALLNTGSVVGAFCNLLPSGNYLPNVIPSFCQARNGMLRERTDLRSVFQTAATVMRRRGFELTDSQMDSYFDLYDHTAAARRQLLHDSEVFRLRQSV